MGNYLRILTLNIRHGGGQRISGVLEYLKEMNSDFLILTEFQHGRKGLLLTSGLATLGYEHLIRPSVADHTNSVLLASRKPIERIEIEPTEADKPRIVGGRVDGLSIVGVYFAGNLRKRSLFEYLLESNLNGGGQCILIGDFNTGQHGLDEAGATFFCTDQFNALLQLGWTDLWRSRHGLQAREYSWYSPKGNGFRIDHAFGCPGIVHRVKSCFYDHATRNALTDHSAMIVELGL
jgi:exodeoxyribonuclease III